MNERQHPPEDEVEAELDRTVANVTAGLLRRSQARRRAEIEAPKAELDAELLQLADETRDDT